MAEELFGGSFESKFYEATLNIVTKPTASRTSVQASSEMSNDKSTETLLKTLLSTSTALSSITVPLSTAKISDPIESMITKEINDTQLNFKKILYEPEKEIMKEKDQDSIVQIISQKSLIDVQIDDDDRLVIDISDDENNIQNKKKAQSMPILEKESPVIISNSLPKSITYSLETTGSKTSCVKIDILTPSASFCNSSTTEVYKSSTASKNVNLSLNVELNILTYEIDKQINKKTNEILELVKEYLESSISRSEFNRKMNEIGSTSINDLSLISRKLIKRHKFEANPNLKDFMKMKFLQFPTSSMDLINYFGSLIATMNKDKFVQMIKFYEIIVKEMLNLNKTKILQYIVDFMIKRKNAQLDMLNYSLEINYSANFKQNISPTSSIFEIPDSTQKTTNERKFSNLRDTNYNFVIRSDPIYLSAGSTFMTNHRDVIKSRSTAFIQKNSFERRPFDNNILKGRRVIRKITSVEDENEKVSSKSRCSQQNNEIKYYLTKPPETPQLLPKTSLAEEKINVTQGEDGNIVKQSVIKCNSPIIVESDNASSSPPIHKIIKPQTVLQQFTNKSFGERIPILNTPKEQKQLIKFPNVTNIDVTNESSNHAKANATENIINLNYNRLSKNSVINGQLSLNEIKTLNQNGTEIIPTPIFRKTITARRKTIDVDHLSIKKSSIEVRKIPIPNKTLKIPTNLSTTKTALDYIHGQSPIYKPSISKPLKRRQSCHERIFIPTTMTTPTRIGKNFIEFMNNEYELKKCETEKEAIQNLQSDDEKSIQYILKQPAIQNLSSSLYEQPKRVRFKDDENLNLQSTNKHSAFNSSQASSLVLPKSKQIQSENQYLRSPHYQSPSNSYLKSTEKSYQSSIDYQQYQLYFERELLDRGFVDRIDTMHNRETSNTLAPNRPLELVSHIPPERYLQQHSESSLNGSFSSSKSTRSLEKPVKSQQRTSIMTNDEKATLVAYHQLQSLHRDPSSLTAQQYSEHLKQIHQIKHMQASPYNSSHGFHQDHQNQLIDERENFYKNIQKAINQQGNESVSTRAPYEFAQIDSTKIQDEREHQSLQRKLKMKAKSSKYVEPSQTSKPYYSTPHSTYYTDPYLMTSQKKASTSIVYNSEERSRQQHTQDNLSAFYNTRSETNPNSQMEYQWMLAQQQQYIANNNNQPARPIPRQAIPTSFNDPKMNGIPSNHNIFHHNAMPLYPNQQSDFYRHYFHPKNF